MVPRESTLRITLQVLLGYKLLWKGLFSDEVEIFLREYS